MKFAIWQFGRRALLGLGMFALSLSPAGAQEALATAAAAPEAPPVVMELFTSLICTNCPKADDLARELHERDDVLVLSFHVDYLNMGQMKDPLSHRAWTARQRWYRDLHQSAYVYTPQVVINGQNHVVGSDRDAVLAGLKAARHELSPIAFTTDHDGVLHLLLDGSALAGRDLELLDLHFSKLARARLTKRGSRMVERLYAHSVLQAKRRRLTEDAEQVQLSWLPKDFKAQGRAVLVQDRDNGAILGAYWGYRP